MSTGTGEEKKSDSFAEDVAEVTAKDNKELLHAEARQVAERRLLRKLDLRLLSTVFLIYFFNHIDRVSITAARLKHFQTDLGLSDVQYDTVVAILYVSYAPAQIPSNMILNYVSRPSIYISTCVVLWGLASALSGVTHNFTGIMTCRIFIGFPEAAFYPGVMYLLSRWYTRKELAFRSAIFYVALLLSNAFGSLWAAAILGGMNGIMGIAAWRWLFYILGASTIFVGFITMWLLPDYPNNTRWLTLTERHLAQVRLAEDVGEADKDSEQASFFEGLKLALKDRRVFLFMLMAFCQTIGLGFSIFLPTLAATFGYSTTITLLLIAPPWVLSAIMTLTNARHADATGERFFHLNVWWWAAMTGYIISLSTMKVPGRYFSVFLMTASFCATSLVLVWVANVVPRPPGKRSAAMSLVNGFSNLGNVVASYIWKSSWAPRYHPPMIISLCAFAFASFLAFVIRVMIVRENKRMEHAELDLIHGPERERIEEAARLEGITFDEAVTRRKGFRYLY